MQQAPAAPRERVATRTELAAARGRIAAAERNAALRRDGRQLFVSSDQQVLVERSATFLNVRASVNGCEPVAIPAELCAAVAAAIALAGAQLAAAH